jgi:predicted MPP superfamily phosphohydrolase
MNLAEKSNPLWDLFCLCSLIGIWPRFIEPNLLATTRLCWKVPHLEGDLQGFRIACFSDIHLSSNLSDRFINRLISQIQAFSPHLILFVGDFLIHSAVNESQRLTGLLNQLTAPYGCFAVLGNHDYVSTGTVNVNGEYDIQRMPSSSLEKAVQRLSSSLSLVKRVTDQAKAVPAHPELLDLLHSTPFQLLHNQTQFIAVKRGGLNVCGLGEYMLGRCLPAQAFVDYKIGHPGIILAHNPDSAPLLQDYPGEMILCGHTHGGQINLPWIRHKLALMENPQWYRGLFQLGKKWLYVMRGIAGAMPFRLFARPELVFITMREEK